MGEILIALFISIWLTAAGIFAYVYLRKEYSQYLDESYNPSDAQELGSNNHDNGEVQA